MNILERVVAIILFILVLPLFLVLYIVFKLSTPSPFLFTQLRAGKNKKPFTIYKIRTMILDAEEKKKNYLHLNEVSGPVFKIRNDPRFTKIGKWLAHSGFDELPQLINIIKGEMAFIGPRPLPINEASKISKKYESRFSILPGITSLWVIKGSHSLNFDEWMKLDIEYVKDRSVWGDFIITIQTIVLLVKNFMYKLRTLKY